MSAGNNPIRVLLAAGGTGGHLFPAEALARALLAAGVKVDLVSDRRAAHFAAGDRAIPIHSIAAGGIAGKGLASRLKNALRLSWGLAQSLWLAVRLRPHCVVGFGGYVSAPPVLAAQLLGFATMIHEQNAVMGRANRLLAARARLIALGFAEATSPDRQAAKKYRVTGNPVRPAILALMSRPYRPAANEDEFHLFIMGGSQGARIFSSLAPMAIEALPDEQRRRLKVAQQCRAEDIDRVRGEYRRLGVAAELKPYFDDVAERLDWAHLTIARAGASTLAELAAAGRPAVLVPLKGSIDGHQAANARAFAQAQAGWAIGEDEAPTMLPQLLARLMREPGALTRAAANARAVGKPEAAAELARLALALARGQNDIPTLERAA